MNETDSKLDALWYQQTLPAEYPITALLIAADWGCSPKTIIDKLNLEYDLSQPRELPLADTLKLFNHLTQLTHPKPLASELGWRLPPTAYGTLGVALLSSATLRECLTIMSRYATLASRDISSFTVEFHHDDCYIAHWVTPRLSASINRLWTETCLFSWRRSFQLLLGGQDIKSEIWFDFPDHTPCDQKQIRFGCVRYDMPISLLRFPESILDQPLPMHNATAKQQALKECERELCLLRRSDATIVTLARRFLLLSSDGYPTLSQLAEHLCLTPRTLRRRLASENSGYQTLLDQARCRDAIRLIEKPELPIQRIAEHLGYSNPANFARRFRAWTGCSPSEYKRKLD